MEKKQSAPLTETAFLILLAMFKPNHGYGVMQFVEERTKGRVIFGPGTLYGAINNLQKKGWIEACPIDNEERKKDYVITQKGKREVRLELLRLKENYEIGMEIINERGGDNDKKV